jgi:hypothetical protein
LAEHRRRPTRRSALLPPAGAALLVLMAQGAAAAPIANSASVSVTVAGLVAPSPAIPTALTLMQFAGCTASYGWTLNAAGPAVGESLSGSVFAGLVQTSLTLQACSEGSEVITGSLSATLSGVDAAGLTLQCTAGGSYLGAGANAGVGDLEQGVCTQGGTSYPIWMDAAIILVPVAGDGVVSPVTSAAVTATLAMSFQCVLFPGPGPVLDAAVRPTPPGAMAAAANCT